MVRIRLADFIESTCPGIDRPLIGLIIDYEQRYSLDIGASLVVFVLCNPTDPIQQVFQDRSVLLDDEEKWI